MSGLVARPLSHIRQIQQNGPTHLDVCKQCMLKNAVVWLKRITSQPITDKRVLTQQYSVFWVGGSSPK